MISALIETDRSLSCHLQICKWKCRFLNGFWSLKKFWVSTTFPVFLKLYRIAVCIGMEHNILQDFYMYTCYVCIQNAESRSIGLLWSHDAAILWQTPKGCHSRVFWNDRLIPVTRSCTQWTELFIYSSRKDVDKAVLSRLYNFTRCLQSGKITNNSAGRREILTEKQRYFSDILLVVGLGGDALLSGQS